MTGLRERNRQTAMAEVQRTAMAMMRTSGFAEVTVEQIAAASGVSPSTVYRYFGTKEALVLWGDRARQVVTVFAAAKIGKKSSAEQAFADAAVAVYEGDDVAAQLALVFANEDLTIAFEHEVIGRRHELAQALADHRSANSVAGRDLFTAGSMLGALIAVLERWSVAGGGKPLSKQLRKAFDGLG